MAALVSGFSMFRLISSSFALTLAALIAGAMFAPQLSHSDEARCGSGYGVNLCEDDGSAENE